MYKLGNNVIVLVFERFEGKWMKGIGEFEDFFYLVFFILRVFFFNEKKIRE